MQKNAIKMLYRFLIIFGSMHFILLMVGAAAFSQEIELPDDPLAGQRVFVKKGCVDCHSIYGRGGKIGRDLGKALDLLGPPGIFAAMWNHSPEMGKLMEKYRDMPVFSEREMADLIAYFFFLSYLDELGDPEQGRGVLLEKRCLSCHKIGGEGGKIGPELDKIKSYANPLYLAQKIWNKGMRMGTLMSTLGIQRPTFDGSELIDLFAYLREISAYRTDSETYMRPGKPKVGRRLFEEKGCIWCHKIGHKDKGKGPDLLQVDFHGGVTRIAERMWNHGPKMWEKMEEMDIERPVFEGNEIADLVAYLYFLNFIEQSGDYEEGKGLFVRKRCSTCHSIQGQGGNVGPDLAQSDMTGNYIRSTTAMWNHNLKMRILMEKMRIPMPRLEENEMRDLFYYLKAERNKHEE